MSETIPEDLMQAYLKSPYLQFQPRADSPEEGDEQTKFVEDSWDGVKILISGNGAGKSEVTAFCVARYLYSTPPPLPVTPYYIVSQDMETVGKIWMQKLSKYIESDQIDNIWWTKKDLYPKMISLKPHANSHRYILYFMSASQGREAMQAVDAGGFWVDEQISQSILEELLARCRTHWNPNSKYYTFTPLRPDPWAQELYERRDEEDVKALYRFYRMNAVKNPFIAQQYKDTYYPTLTPEQRATRVFGDFCNYSGVVYKYFTGDLILDSYDISQAVKFYCGIDLGYRHPAFVKIACIEDRFYVFDEYHGNDMLPEELAVEVKKRNWDYRYRAVADSEDPGAIRILANHSVHCIPPNKGVVDGIEYISNLMYNKKLFVLKSCKTLVLQLKSYQWLPEKEGREIKEEVLKINDHGPDALRYALYTMRTSDVKPWTQIQNTKVQLVNPKASPLLRTMRR